MKIYLLSIFHVLSLVIVLIIGPSTKRSKGEKRHKACDRLLVLGYKIDVLFTIPFSNYKRNSLTLYIK